VDTLSSGGRHYLLELALEDLAPDAIHAAASAYIHYQFVKKNKFGTPVATVQGISNTGMSYGGCGREPGG
jgi:hypothetical protein